MNYGYSDECKGWKPERKMALALRLCDELKLRMGWSPSDDPDKPYVEVDGLYSGVRIRRITHIPEDEKVALVRKADRIYDEVMA